MKVASLDTSFLKLENPTYNLYRLSTLDLGNAAFSTSTLKIFKALPRQNPIRLGYDDPIAYQTELGDRAIGTLMATSALAFLGICLAILFECGAANRYPQFSQCVGWTANILQNETAKTFFATLGLLLSASLFAHRKGWLGAFLHDPALKGRCTQTKGLFQSAAQTLFEMAKTKPEETAKLARHIFRNLPLIQHTLHVDIQIPEQIAKEISEMLKTACTQVLDSWN
jgi:hypothetical protein